MSEDTAEWLAILFLFGGLPAAAVVAAVNVAVSSYNGDETIRWWGGNHDSFLSNQLYDLIMLYQATFVWFLIVAVPRRFGRWLRARKLARVLPRAEIHRDDRLG